MKIAGVEFNDEYGIVTQASGDSGDSSQRTATLVNLLALTNRHLDAYYVYALMMRNLKVSKGRYKRSSIPGFWGNDPTNFSRDQHSILRLSMAILGDKEELKESTLEMLKRFCFHQNFLRGTDDPEKKWKLPDVMAPSEWSVIIRGLSLWPLYPVLLILDLGLVADLWLRKRNTWDYDNMMCQNLLFAVWKMPTPLSLWVFKRYYKTDWVMRVQHYHSPEKGGVAGLSALFVEAYLSTRRYLGYD